jgi:putative ATP-dependent endonuclease of the OLD family
MGGSRNFGHFAADATINLLTRRQVKSWFILDRDERSEENISSLTHSLGQNSTMHVLRRRELENYLAQPTALSLLIAERANVALEEDEVREMLDTTANDLRNVSVSKRLAA